MSEEQKQLQKQELSLSARFMNKVMTEFTSGVGEIALTNFQKRLVQNYFIAINTALQKAEAKRLQKNSSKYAKDKDRESLPVTWINVNMEQLAQNVVACARIGLDPALRNHVAMSPFKNNATNKYDIVFIEGYRGIELKSMKYGLDIPDEVVVELVCQNDKFKPLKKSFSNKIESYEFEIVNPFDRGEIIGGFYYHAFTSRPEKNKLVMMSLKDILKRKPKYAAPEFWGGEKAKWEDGKKVGVEAVEGWYEKMVYKTVYRAAYGDITIDSQKIDDDFLRLSQMEDSIAKHQAEAEIAERANKGPLVDLDEDDDPLATDAEFTEVEPPGDKQEPPREEVKSATRVESANDEAPY